MPIDPVTGSMLAGGAVELLGNIFGGGDNDAEESMRKAIEVLEKVGPAPDLSDPVVLQAFQQAGILTPELLQKLNLNADQQTELVEDPTMKRKQEYALNALKDLSQTGLSAADRAVFNELRSQTAGDTNAKLQQVLQEQQMRGQSGAGATLAAQLSAIQGGNQNASKEADRLAQVATQARRSALSDFSNLAGNMRNTDLNVTKTNLENELARQRFLDENSLSRQAGNVAAINAANTANLQRQQGVSDKNVAQGNEELYRQVDAKRQKYLDDLQRAGMISGVHRGNADLQQQQAENSAQANANMWSGIGNLTSQAMDMDWSKIFGGGKTSGGAGSVGSSDRSVAMKAAGGFVGSGEGELPVDTNEKDVVPVLASKNELIIPESHAHDPDLAKAYINYVYKNKNKK